MVQTVSKDYLKEKSPGDPTNWVQLKLHMNEHEESSATIEQYYMYKTCRFYPTIEREVEVERQKKWKNWSISEQNRKRHIVSTRTNHTRSNWYVRKNRCIGSESNRWLLKANASVRLLSREESMSSAVELPFISEGLKQITRNRFETSWFWYSWLPSDAGFGENSDV